MVEIMKDNKVIDNELVEVFHAEDSIFNNCMNDFEEFPSYITGYDDIEEYYPTKHMKENYKNLILDSVRKRKNKGLINMEHHSRLTRYLFRRDYSYITILVEASGEYVEPFIFNTGPIPSKKVIYANDTMFFNPAFFNTQEKLTIVNLNNLRYKISNKEELTQKDCLDLIWLVKSGIEMDKENLLHELTVELWSKAVAPKWMLDAVRKNLIIWAKKYLVDKEKIKEFKGVVKMSKLEVLPFEEQIRGAGIAGQLERAEKNGLKEGYESGKKEIISTLLKKHSPEEVSEMTETSLAEILEIQNEE
jgi:hypothetical protein